MTGRQALNVHGKTSLIISDHLGKLVDGPSRLNDAAAYCPDGVRGRQPGPPRPAAVCPVQPGTPVVRAALLQES